MKDLARDVAEDLLGAAKNGNVEVLIILSVVKARAGHVASFPRLSLVARKRKRLYAYPHPCPSGGPSRRA